MSDSDSYLQFQIPSLPFSAVRVPLVPDLEEQEHWVTSAMLAAQLLANAYHEAFSESPPEPSPRPQQRPVQQQAQRTNGTPQRAPRPAPAAAVVKGIGAYCPEHPNVEAIPSKEQYARFEEDEFGNQVQANFFCPGAENGTGKNHQLWRRQLVWPEPEAAAF